tara:strand:- start:48 stop:908 length:861 start_codon:yes stop_codon:yes gene_type:complete
MLSNISNAETMKQVEYCNYNSIDTAEGQKKFRFRGYISSGYKRSILFLNNNETEKAIKVLKQMLNKRLKPYERAKVNENLGFIYLRNNEVKNAINYYEKSLEVDGLVFEEKIELMLKITQIYFTYQQIEKGHNSLKSLDQTINKSKCKIKEKENVFKKINQIANMNVKDLLKNDYSWLILRDSKIDELDDNDLTILYKYAAEYPSSARASEIEGWVLLEFDINKEGKATNIKMIDYEPSKAKIFRNNSIKALKKWKFKPPIKNGEIVIKKSIKTKFSFSLEDEKTY